MSNFLFPLETTARELDHKILMSILSVKEGRTVYVGDQQIIRTLSRILKGGVFYGKHLFGKPMFSDKQYYTRLKERNFKIVHLNEEGAVWPGAETEWKYLMKQSERPSILSSDDFMAVWGEWQKNFNESYEEVSASIEVTGHPRFDLYRNKYLNYFAEDVKKIVDKYEDYILVNTAFSYANNGEDGVNFIFKPTISYDANNIKHRQYRFKRWKNQMFSIADLVNLIHDISIKFPNKKIILRPHPSENTSYYEQIFQNIDNVFVVYSGAVAPWILGCKLLIHNGCTTAIEATLANKPVINYHTSGDKDFDIYLANICGVTMNKSNDVLEYINDVYNDSVKLSIPNDKKANELFHNFQIEDSAKINKELLDRADNLVNCKNITKVSRITLKLLSLYHKGYLFLKYSYFFFKGKYNNYLDYKKRFVSFDKATIEKVKKMADLLGIEIEIVLVSEYLFYVKANDC